MESMTPFSSFRLRDESDRAILKRITSREEAALSELFDRYGSIVYTLLMRMLRAVDETEEILEDVFLQAWNKPDAYQPSKWSVYAWILTVARNGAVERLRSRGQRKQTHPSGALLAPPNLSLGRGGEGLSDEQKSVAGILSGLSAQEQNILALAYYDCQTQTEISAKLNISTEGVKSGIRSGLTAIRTGLEKGSQK